MYNIITANYADFEWWIGEDTDNLTMFSDDELYEIMSDIERK